MVKIVAAALCLLLCAPPLFARELNADDMLDRLKSAVDLGFKQRDAVKPLVKQYVTVLQLLKEQAAGNEQLLHAQIQALNKQLEGELKGLLSPEQMDAFRSNKRSLLAS